LVHSAPITYGADATWHFFPWFIQPFCWTLVPAFFSLSGFLVSASLLRTTIPAFIGLRVLRIFPALIVEVCLSALILGPLLTQLPISDYFVNGRLHAYFYNLVGYIHYDLPGVFTHNPYPIAVNGSLWTVPFELQCYVLLVGIGLLGLTRRWCLMILVLAISTLYLVADNYQSGVIPFNDGRMLVLDFIAGVVIYSLGDVVPLRIYYFVALLAVSLSTLNTNYFVYVAPLPTAYCTAYLGLLQPRQIKLVASGDYSYGIYLYAFPLQQTVVCLTPVSLRIWLVNAAFSVVLVSVFATLSWHFIEKPTLGLKRYLKRGNLDVRDRQLAGVFRSSGETADIDGRSGDSLGVAARAAVRARESE